MFVLLIKYLYQRKGIRFVCFSVQSHLTWNDYSDNLKANQAHSATGSTRIVTIGSTRSIHISNIIGIIRIGRTEPPPEPRTYIQSNPCKLYLISLQVICYHQPHNMEASTAHSTNVVNLNVRHLANPTILLAFLFILAKKSRWNIIILAKL